MMGCAGFCLKKIVVAVAVSLWFVIEASAMTGTTGQPCGPLCAFARDTLGPGQDIRLFESVKKFFETQFASGTSQRAFYRVRDTADYIIFLKSRVRFFEDNNHLLKSFIESAGRGRAAAEQPLERLKREEAAIYETALYMDFSAMDHAADLAQVFAALKEVESSLVVQLKKMQIINDELRSLKMQVVAHGRGMMLDETAAVCFAQIEAVRTEMSEKVRVIERQDQDIQALSQEVQALTLSVDIFRERLHVAGEKIDILTADLASTTLDFFQKERETLSLRRSAEDMAAEFEESRERLRLVQHIIQEKDRHIQKLEEEMSQIQSDMAAGGIQSTVNVLRDEMNEAVDGLKGDIAHSQDKINRLEERFQEVALANAYLESELSKKELHVAFLERQVSAKNELIMDLERGFQLRMRQLSELRDVIAIYQMKLKEYKDMLAEKDRAMEDSHTRQGELPSGPDDVLGKDLKEREAEMINVPDISMWTEDMIKDYSKDALDRMLSAEEE